MRYLTLILFSFFFISTVKTQVFNRTYNYFSTPFFNPNTGNLLYRNDAFGDIVMINDKIFLRGTTTKYLSFNEVDQYIVLIDLNGEILLEDTINLINFGREQVGNPYFYDDNSLILFGRITDGTLVNSNGAMVKLDSNYNLIEIFQFNFGEDTSFPVYVTYDNGKTFYVLAFADVIIGQGINYDIFIAKVDSSGTLIDTFQYGGGDYDLGRSIHQLQNGNLLIAGETDSYGAGRTDFYLFETDTLGNMLWQQTYGYPGNEQFGAQKALYVTEEEEFYLCGTTYLQNGNPVAWLVKTDRQGNMLWEKKYERGQFFDHFKEIHAANDGTLIVVGSTRDHSLTDEFNVASRPMPWLLKMDTSGNIIWERLITIYDDPFDTDVYSEQSILAPDGGVIMAGYVIAGYIQTDGVLHLNDGWACKTDSCGFTTGDEPEPLILVQSNQELTIQLQNATQNYCTATLTWGDGTQEQIYAYSQPIYGYSPNLTYTYTQPGTYQVCIEALAGEEFRSYCTEVIIEPNSINSLPQGGGLGEGVKIFPNPTNNYFILETPLSLGEGQGEGLAYSPTGQLVYQFEIKPQLQQKIDISHLPEGVYIIKIETNQFSTSKKLVVVR